ncbi:DoxX family protein [Streptomyces sp. NPDC005955]|uniref:DoxX family protein n=1 Tax=Streptomyces sp. NPDC005955 TaxID=3364738 RepID=UPI0036C90A55
MNVFLWVLQILLVLVMLAAGGSKLAQSREKLAVSMNWVNSFTPAQIRGIGVLEVLAAIGLVAPAATDLAPVWTPIAAVGVALLMIGAAITHLRARELPSIAVNAVLFVIAVVIAWGRFGPYAF